jgi:hypothetical protein
MRVFMLGDRERESPTQEGVGFGGRRLGAGASRAAQAARMRSSF